MTTLELIEQLSDRYGYSFYSSLDDFGRVSTVSEAEQAGHALGWMISIRSTPLDEPATGFVMDMGEAYSRPRHIEDVVAVLAPEASDWLTRALNPSPSDVTRPVFEAFEAPGGSLRFSASPATGTALLLFEASQPAMPPVDMDDVVCMSLAEARQAIADAELALGDIAPADADDDWLVVAQVPIAGAVVLPGTRVTLLLQPASSGCGQS